MPCDCLEQITKQLEEKHTGIVELKTTDTLTMVGDRYQAVSYPGTLEYTYCPNKSDGSPGRAKKKNRVYFSRCPFCGTSYREETA